VSLKHEGNSLTPEVKAHLLTSMDAGRLVILCGAGLSMAPPSALPSALRVAQVCFDAYQLKFDPTIDLKFRNDLEAFAEHFVSLNTLKAHFIENLVPWSEFERPPNLGHAAIADFLITRSMAAGLSGNYDKLIERCAWSYGADFIGALDGDEATASAHKQAPLLKFHGCATRDRGSTVWAPSQLDDPIISERIAKTKLWMAANLRQKDLLVVGFWSDWGYLNQIFSEALDGLNPLSVTVVDLSSEVELEQKAPKLWAIAHEPQVKFQHVRESGADVLDELRRAFSESYLRQVLSAGCDAFQNVVGTPCPPGFLKMAELDSESLYAWRRDAEGVPNTRPAINNRPSQSEMLGFFHLQLRSAGAEQEQFGYNLAGKRIRVVNGAGTFLSTIRARFVESPATTTADIVVAVGAEDLGLPAHVVRSGAPSSVLRPAAVGKWLTAEQAKAELGI
jgi:hypothetical protein